MTEENKKKQEFTGLINSRIEGLRPKLLDLTRKNPLLSIRFSEKSNSLIKCKTCVQETGIDVLKAALLFGGRGYVRSPANGGGVECVDACF
jgi:hypothetical protein